MARGDLVALTGSPPRPWGPQAAAIVASLLPRFTPTPVGTTLSPEVNRSIASVHPHARGDHGSLMGPAPLHPVHPHARGDHRPSGPQPSRSSGSPPTPVGTTSCPQPGGTDHSVHPHARGDHKLSRPTGIFVAGSPPRPWGPHELLGCRLAERRFTPTPVGTTSAPNTPANTPSVHPHARGDHGRTSISTGAPSGSPPRPWGPRHNVGLGGQRNRFTPTPVGTTARQPPS